MNMLSQIIEYRNKSIGLNRHLNHPIQFPLEHPVRLLDILQLIPVRNQRRGVDLALFDEPQDLGAVAAVHAAGFEGEVFAVHVGQGNGLG